MLRFKELYQQKIIENLQKEFSYKNKHEIPQIKKIVIN
ncbi:MAG: 50S ribosomal protein L5, partial [Rickettsia sp.]